MKSKLVGGCIMVLKCADKLTTMFSIIFAPQWLILISFLCRYVRNVCCTLLLYIFIYICSDLCILIYTNFLCINMYFIYYCKQSLGSLVDIEYDLLPF